MDVGTLRGLLDEARRAGAKEAEILFEHAEGQRVGVVRGRPVLLPAQDAVVVTVRVWKADGRCGVASGPAGDFRALVAAALAAASASPADPLSGPVERSNTPVGGLGIFDRRFDGITALDREEVVISADRAVRATDRRFTPSGFQYHDRVCLRRLVNTRGVVLDELDTTFHLSGTAAPAGRGASINARVDARSFASIASAPLGAVLAARLAALTAAPADLRGPVRVLLPPTATAALVDALASRLGADSLDSQPGFLRPRDDGRPTLDARLHLHDDGLLQGGLRTTSFDDRGVMPVPLTLVREGRVEGRYVSPELSRRFDARPTGHVVRGSLRPSNLVLRAGTRSMNAALMDLGGPFLQLDDLPDLRRSIDFETGSLQLRVSGAVLDGNRQVGAVHQRALSGDLRASLANVVEVCSDTDRVGHVDAPGLILRGFTLD